MVDDIKAIKDKVLGHVMQMVTSRGIDRVDVKTLGEYADIIKDLAEAEEKCCKAEYYKVVTKEMHGGDDALPSADPVELVRELTSTDDVRKKAQLREELSKLIGM